MDGLVEARVEDAEVIARLGAQTFAETFVGVAYYTQELVDGYAAGAYTPEKIRKELADPGTRTWLVWEGGEVAGYLKVAEKDVPDCIRGTRAICLDRIYLLKEHKGKGHGRLLLATAREEARRRGYPKMWLSVWEHNHAARSFYEKDGWRVVGEWEWAFESHGKRHVDRDLVMVLDLPATQSLQESTTPVST